MAWRIMGHERAVRALSEAARADTPAHAYLIVGPPRIGKRTLARELAAALNCDAPASERPCHSCSTCRMIAHEGHPDLIVVERSEDRRLKIEQIRDVRGAVEWRPYQGRFKVYIFVDADEMTEGAANALLKTLEEPPPQVVIALTASHADAVPATILSRCRVVALQPVPRRQLASGLVTLYGARSDEAERLAALANGAPGWAMEALADPALVAEREREVARAAQLSHGPLSRRLLLVGEICSGKSFIENRSLCLRTLEDMRLWWRDLLLVASGSGAPLAHVDRRDELERQASARGRERIVRGLREIELTAASVERNVTPRLALEALLLRLN